METVRINTSTMGTNLKLLIDVVIVDCNMATPEI